MTKKTKAGEARELAVEWYGLESHPVRVGDWLAVMGVPEEIVAAGYLHDMMEDGFMSEGLLWASHFKAQTIDLVRLVSRDPKVETYQSYIERIGLFRAATLVKLVDLYDNYVNRSATLSVGLARRYKDALSRLLGTAARSWNADWWWFMIYDVNKVPFLAHMVVDGMRDAMRKTPEADRGTTAWGLLNQAVRFLTEDA